jgi:hypothetical protein
MMANDGGRPMFTTETTHPSSRPRSTAGTMAMAAAMALLERDLDGRQT